MKKIQFLPLVCCLASLLWLFTQCATAQDKTPSLTEQERISVLEIRQNDLKEQVNENQKELEEKIDKRLESEKERIEDAHSSIEWILIIAGILITIFGLIVPVISSVAGYRWFKKERAEIDTIKKDIEHKKDEVDAILDQIKQKRDATEKATQELSKITQNLLLEKFDPKEVQKIADNKDVEPFARDWAEVLLLYKAGTKSNSDYEEIINKVQAILNKNEYADKIAFRYLAELCFIMAYSYNQLKKYIQAYNYYNAVTTLLPNRASTWYNEGIALAKLGDLEKEDNKEQAKEKYIAAIKCFENFKTLADKNKHTEFINEADNSIQVIKNITAELGTTD